MITSGKDGEFGYAFRYLDDAKVAVELDHAGKRGAIGLFASSRTRARRPRINRSQTIFKEDQ